MHTLHMLVVVAGLRQTLVLARESFQFYSENGVTASEMEHAVGAKCNEGTAHPLQRVVCLLAMARPFSPISVHDCGVSSVSLVLCAAPSCTVVCC